MNTNIYMENPNEKNHGLRLELGGGFTMSKSAKKSIRHKAHPTMPTSVIHNSHTPSFYKLNARALLKKEIEALLHSNTLYLSRENKWNTLPGCLHLHN